MRQFTHILVFGLAFKLLGCGDPQLRNPKQSSVQAEPCGTVIGSLDGIYAFSNGSANETGVSCAGEDGIYGWEYQCKELVSRYFTKKFGSPLVFCDAGQCLDAFSRYPNDFQTFNNGTQLPKHGDAIVFAGRPGHIAVIDKVADGKITFLQQNTPQRCIKFSDFDLSLGRASSCLA